MNSDEEGTDQRGHADLDEVTAAWFHKLDNARAEDAAELRRSFQLWLAASPDHPEAFARTAAIWDAIGEHSAAPEMMTVRQAALADAQDAALARWRPPSHATHARWPKILAATLIASISLGALAYFLLRPTEARLYATDIGERHAVTLADNSRVEIDADSAISADFTPDRRLVHVIRGEAYFAVEKDPSRPFVVESNGRRVVATGTAFSVETLTNGLRVTLVEGHVAVQLDSAADSASHSVAELSPNDQLTATSGAPTQIVHGADIVAALAWRQGKLLFTNEKLSEAIARLKHYSHVEVIADPKIANLRISGVFDAGDTTAFVDAVKAYYHVDAVSDRPNEWRLISRR